MNVLVVDDSGTMRTIQTRCLNSLGILDVTAAEDGEQALQLFDANSFDLVISDWNMPKMDGLDLLKEIRQRDKEVPFIMVTTESERARVLEAIREGVSDYLTKPFSATDLQQKISKLVSVTV